MRRLPIVALLFLGCIPGPQQPPACPLYLCDPNCGPNGVKTDSNGCLTCECNDAPVACQGLSEAACLSNSTCEPEYQHPPICGDGSTTSMHAEDVYVGCVDRQHECAPLGCRMDCPNGVKLDANGCDTCECNEPVDAGPVCQAFPCPYCANGYVQDANGCNTCQCAPEQDAGVICPEVMCAAIFCQYGPQLDPNGCFTCGCNPAPVCPELLCDMACEYGNVVDANGCDTCACNPPPTCPDEMCAIYCDNGYVQDANGCNTCQCAPEDAGVQ